ncbi:MAG TPA: phosphoenolpyruvate carboxylase, partial [Solirubrobacteraceae bacterium]|nr:phosphoenolpyruvate carboxylase [Solirubrobacteraceae bacterium]
MTVPDSLSEHSHDALRADIRRLSTMLGQTIALHGGPDLLELVEQVRKESRVAIASGDDAAISALLTGLDSGTAVWLARAFSQFFQLANIAEQRHRA